MAGRPHIVVVEDEAAGRQLLTGYLTARGYRVTAFASGVGLRRLVERELPTLVLLDIGLPGEDGLALARWLREKSNKICIIMVTSAGETVDRIVGLESGADDYLPKPFEPRELLARIKSVLRRTNGMPPATPATRVRMGRRVLDLERHILLEADGSEEALSASEFELLKLFADNPNKPLERNWMLERIANREMASFDRAIDLRINRIRRKIEHDPEHPLAIRTVWGVGYMFVPPQD
jgi:two-component system phosphate regulon response regulator OmpR